MMELFDAVDPARRAILLSAREVGISLRTAVWLVGGPVRDLRLGEPVRDLDFVVDASHVQQFAAAFASALGGRIRRFPRFMTFTIEAAGLPLIDVATARRESYRAPGALPEVTAGGIAEDLTRRDFSINAIAIELIEGQLVDPLGGMADLEQRRIRILHPRSFLDDPTRLLRALRFAVRLGFGLEETTGRAMEHAISAGALRSISRTRLWREVMLAFAEPHPGAVLCRMGGSGALDLLFPGVQYSSAFDLAMRSLEIWLPEGRIDTPVAMLGRLAAASSAAPDLSGSSFTLRRIAQIESFRESASSIRDRFEKVETPDQALEAIGAAGTLTLAAAAIAGDDRFVPMLRRYIVADRIARAIPGSGIHPERGRHIGHAIDETRAGIFRGELAPAEAASFASAIALQYLRSH
ncbi:MAG: hypothetical protein WBX15_03700 [Thermoanaerobaculia bacterium]